MKKTCIIIICILLLGAAYYFHSQGKTPSSRSTTSFFQKKEPTITSKPVTKTESVFVPYWAQMTRSDRDEYDRYIYFGVTVDEQGVVTGDDGYNNMLAFTSFAQGKEKWLTVRMLDHDKNTTILGNSSTWVGIAHSVAEVAQANGFDGVVLDLEVGLISFHIAPDSISGFSETMAHEIHLNNMKYGMAIYGDTSYRKRPYDVKTLSKNTDEVMIMAYDFHKSFGEAGPNFPLNGIDTYGYDFTTMIDDFSAVVPAEKLSIIYGMYGYEWIVDEQDRPLKSASALTLNQIQSRFLDGCQEKECVIKRDDESAETEISFKDDQDRKHVVWFEDRESVSQKQKAAEKQGIGQTIFWAYGYF